ncbi:MAG TPA: DUF427 domain-containing protein [Microlunatus sp.]|jgi:uncharacterized protein (DUF427 family)|nr:DUF427 domain-containing protein [Microlunatus sp.]
MAVQLQDLLWGTLAELRYQPVPRRIRALLNGRLVLETMGAAVVWEPQRVVPTYALPIADVLADVTPAPPRSEPVTATPVRLGSTMLYDPSAPFAFHTTPGRELTLRVGDQDLDGVAFAPDDPALADYVILDFDAFDWLEEDEPLVAHPRDPFSRIDVRASGRTVRFEHQGQLVAESSRSLMLFEGALLPPRYYLPREDVAAELRPSDRWSVCAYKGRATYWSAVVGDEVLPDLVWSYPDPLADMRLIAGRVSLFNERLDVFLDGVQQPKPVTPWS